MVQNLRITSNPGQALKELRRQQGWTLAQVSQRTGLPVSTLSKMEHGKVSLSYDKLARMSTGLGIDIGAFFSTRNLPVAGTGPSHPTSQTTGRRSIARKGEGHLIETEVYSHRYVASDLLNKHFVPVVADIRARSIEQFGELIRHAGEEYAYVLEGSLDLYTDLYAPVRLNAGDSIYFDSGIGHAYIAVGDAPCKLISICSGAESHLRASMERAQPVVAADEPKSKPRRARRGHHR